MSTAYNPPSEKTHYLTLREATAEGYGAYSTLRSWIAQGRLPAVKTGGRVKVLRSDLDAFATPVSPRLEISSDEDIRAWAERQAASAPNGSDRKSVV
mgnify:CR=1 FL=1